MGLWCLKLYPAEAGLIHAQYSLSDESLFRVDPNTTRYFSPAFDIGEVQAHRLQNYVSKRLKHHRRNLFMTGVNPEELAYVGVLKLRHYSDFMTNALRFVCNPGK
jgi:hypothetical protein